MTDKEKKVYDKSEGKKTVGAETKLSETQLRKEKQNKGWYFHGHVEDEHFIFLFYIYFIFNIHLF